LCYVEHRFNHHLVPLARKYNVLGMIVPAAFGGRETDALTYARAWRASARKGPACAPSFPVIPPSASIPSLPGGVTTRRGAIFRLHAKAKKILAFGLTEPMPAATRWN